VTPDERRSSFKSIALLTLVPIAGLSLFLLWNAINEGVTPRQVVEAVATATVARRSTAHPQKAAVLPEREEKALPKVSRRRGKGSIVLIIDDLGFDGQPLDRVMTLDPNLNVAILPNGTRTTEFAERLNARGFEILCHLPMEPRGNETPGRNAILTSMTDEEIARATRENLAAVPHARGMNNHMGSRATTDRRVMASVLGALPQGIYFIDSRTTGGSVAAEVAREMNVPTATRQVFLDDVATEAAVRKQLESLADAAHERGIAVGIGHPYPVTLRVLAEQLPGLKERGIRLVRASEVVR
jgi:uncharacterized protein